MCLRLTPVARYADPFRRFCHQRRPSGPSSGGRTAGNCVCRPLERGEILPAEPAVEPQKLALTSKTPGKTRTLNYYRVNETLHFVDLPGYGYAKRGQQERRQWADLVNRYLETRTSLRGILHLMDARHDPTSSDVEMALWLMQFGRPFLVVATKADKLTGSRQKSRAGPDAEPAFPTGRIRFRIFFGSVGPGSAGCLEVDSGYYRRIDPPVSNKTVLLTGIEMRRQRLFYTGSHTYSRQRAGCNGRNAGLPPGTGLSRAIEGMRSKGLRRSFPRLSTCSSWPARAPA